MGRTIDLKNATIKFKDGSGTPKTVTLTIGSGNVTWSEKRNMEYRLDRGKLNTVKQGDEIPVEVSLQFEWRELMSISGDTTPTPYEVLKQIGAAAGWVSSDTVDPCAPYAVDIEITHNPDCNTAGTDFQQEITLLSDFRWENIDPDVGAAQVSVSGKCNITAPTITRSNVT